MKFLYWILASASYSSSSERNGEESHLSPISTPREPQLAPPVLRRRQSLSGFVPPVNALASYSSSTSEPVGGNSYPSPTAAPQDPELIPPLIIRRSFLPELALRENEAEDHPPPNKRVAPDTSVRNLPRVVQRIIDAQNTCESEFPYWPELSSRHETVPEFGTLTIENLLGTGRDSNVFSVVERRDVVLKYQSRKATKTGRYSLHPLVVDFWIGRMAWRLGVSAKPHFVSLGQMSNNGASIKTEGLEGDGIVRYMVLERVESCLDSLIDDPIGLYYSAVLGRNVVANLRKLHNAGICHGDIHSGNICLKDSKLVFIDFEMAFFSSEESFLPSRPRLSYVHSALTPWQLEGFPFSRRDDVYKAIFLIAEAAIGRTRFWHGKLDLSRTNPEELLAWKKEGNLFVSGDYDPVERDPRLSPEKKIIARDTLQEILRIVRGLSDTDIPYDSIITLLESIIQLYR
jgi:hypothetical protein